MLHDSALPIERVKRTATTLITDAAGAAKLPAIDHLRNVTRLG
jgi:hypothetical protein